MGYLASILINLLVLLLKLFFELKLCFFSKKKKKWKMAKKRDREQVLEEVYGSFLQLQ